MTGLRPETLGIYDLATNFRKARPDAITVAQYFKNHGYRTEAFGKIFHVGHGNIEDPGETKNLASERPETVADLKKILAAHPEAKPQIRAQAGPAAKPKPKSKPKAKS